MANKRYPGSPNIAKLVNKAIQNQDWKKTECLPLSDYPLRPNERDTLHKLAVGDTTLTVFLGKRGNPPTEKYITLDAKEFPKKLISKLLVDDHDGKLNDVASMRIEADVDIDGEPVKMTLIHTLPDEDERKWYPTKTDMENIFEIKDGVLLHCTVNNPKVVIPDGVTAIDSKAFRQPDSIYGLDEVTSVSIPESVVKIGSGAFQWCKKLTKASIKGRAEIGSEAFLGCSSLKEVYLADGVRSIGSDCFSFCEELQYLFIPESVETIGYEIARQNDGTIRQPTFRCYSKGIGEGWNSDWNLIHFDRRFWDNPNYYYYHPTFFGVTRNGTARTDISHRPAIGMPHGTGVKTEDSIVRIEGHHLPKTKLRLWLSATLISIVGEKEYLLDDEEREILPRINRDNDNAILRPLDEPWEITVDEDTRHLAPELKISAWINDFYDIFDGHTLVVHHDMPWHNNRYSYYPTSKLTMGGTVIAEKHIMNGGFIYDVRLHIHWPEQEYRKYSLDEASELIIKQLAEWKLNDTDYEIDALLAHNHLQSKKYKTYKLSELPTKLMEDIKTDGEKWSDLGQIVLQPYEFYEETHSFSDDYKDAARAYGEDCDDWTTTERRRTKGSFAIEMYDV